MKRTVFDIAFVVGLVFSLYIGATAERQTVLILGDSVGLQLLLKHPDIMDGYRRDYRVVNAVKIGASAADLLEESKGIEAQPDTILLFCGAVDGKMLQYSIEETNRAIADIADRFPGAMIVWMNTAEFPRSWTTDSVHPTQVGFRNIFQRVNPIVWSNGEQIPERPEWLSVIRPDAEYLTNKT